MKICIVSEDYPPDTASGGIGTQACLKARGLVELGHEVQVLSQSRDGQPRNELDQGVRVRRIPGPDIRFSIHTEAAWWLVWSCEVAACLLYTSPSPRDRS